MHVRLTIWIAALLMGMLVYLAPTPVQAQVITEGPDSVLVEVPDTLAGEDKFFLSNFKNLKNLDKPAKAALWSAVIPGGGQFYNHSYWKIPIVYATAGVLGYYLIHNNNEYQSYRVALIERTDENPATIDEYADDEILGTQNGTAPGSYAVRNLKYRRDGYRRNRDLTILLSIGAYGLQIAEAYVHAHLKEFDVSDNLSLRVQPTVVPVPATTPALVPALTLTLYTRSK